MTIKLTQRARTLLNSARSADCERCRALAESLVLTRTRRKRGQGAKPYGQLPGEAETLAMIMTWSSDGLSHSAIAQRLNVRHIPTRRGTDWWPTVISRIVRQHR